MKQTSIIGIVWLAALLFPASGLAQRTSPEGTWIGHWVREDSTVDVLMRFSRSPGGYQGSFDSEGLRVIGIPMQNIRWEPPKLRWEVVGDFAPETYEAVLRGDSMAGQFTQGKVKVDFSASRSKNAVAITKREEITFANGDVTLAGTVLIPIGNEPFPGIVFLHGSGAEGRWASGYLAEKFARAGFAALVFDKRGVGKSGGDWQKSGFEELAADAAAAFAALAAKPYVAKGRVGIHGHSQGGILAPMAALRIGNPAFVIASAASGVSMRETETYSVENSIGLKDLGPAEAAKAREFVNAIMATAFDGQPYERGIAAWQVVREKPWSFELPPETHSYWSFSNAIAAYDALSYWGQVSAPTLLVFGEADERVPPRASAARISGAYLNGKGCCIEVVLFPNADHTFRLRSNQIGAFMWPRTVLGYPETLINWARRIVASLRNGEEDLPVDRADALGAAELRR